MSSGLGQTKGTLSGLPVFGVRAGRYAGNVTWWKVVTERLWSKALFADYRLQNLSDAVSI